MDKTNPTEVLNDHIEDLLDYIRHKFKILGISNGLSDSQLSYMEREFIARMAFAAIIGDDEKEPDKKTEKSDGLPSDVINALLYAKRMCESHECDECPFGSSGRLFCKLSYNPKDWEV